MFATTHNLVIGPIELQPIVKCHLSGKKREHKMAKMKTLIASNVLNFDPAVAFWKGKVSLLLLQKQGSQV